MRHDTSIIEAFLRGHNEAYETTFSLREIPDDGGRRRGIDGLARNASNQSWALEHTLLEPFWGEREDTRAFLAVFAPLEMDTALVVPGYEFDLFSRVGAIPKGVRWDWVRTTVRSWLLANMEHFEEGMVAHCVPGLPFRLEIYVDKARSDRARVFVGRMGVPDTRARVVRKALSRKLAKLIQTPADIHTLIFEKADIATGYVGVTDAVDALMSEFPELRTLDSIWVAASFCAESEDTVFFLRVWPGGVTAKFKSKWDVAPRCSGSQEFRQGTASAVPLANAREGGFSR
jgi:hypothetical protein